MKKDKEEIDWNEEQPQVNTKERGYHNDVTKVKNVCYKPFDIIKDKDSNYGMIIDSSINHCQPTLKDQISYHVSWFDCDNYNSWWDHKDIEYVNNFFLIIAQNQTRNYKTDTMDVLFGGSR